MILKLFYFFVILFTTLVFSNPFLEKAFTQHKAREFQKAEMNYIKAIENGANATIVNYNLGNLYYQTKKTSQAIIKYKTVITQAPKFKNAYHNLGKIFFLNDELVKALDIFLAYNKINPLDWDTLILIGDTFKKLQLYAEANKYYEQALALDQENENSYIILAELYIELFDKNKAFYYLDLALENKINSLRIREFKADLFLEDEKYFQAIFIYQEILNDKNITLTSQTKHRLKTKIVDGFLNKGVTQLAINELQKLVLEFKEENDMLKLEELYRKQEKIEEGFIFFKKLYPESKTKVYPIIKNLLIFAFNNENKDLINDIILFYEDNAIKDEVYSTVKYEIN